MELDLTKLLNKISKHILPPIVLVPHILSILVDKIFNFGKILFNVFLEQWILLYVFNFVTLQCKMFVDVLKNIYVKLEYAIRKLPKCFCFIFFLSLFYCPNFRKCHISKRYMSKSFVERAGNGRWTKGCPILFIKINIF